MYVMLFWWDILTESDILMLRDSKQFMNEVRSQLRRVGAKMIYEIWIRWFEA